MRRRESQIRLQCFYLTDVGLLNRVGNESYTLSDRGKLFLDDESSLPTSAGFFALDELLPAPSDRISDCSILSQLKIKRQNSEFYQRRKNYSLDTQDIRRGRKQIWSVKRWKLTRLLAEFPKTVTVVDQCAHWMRAVVGLHLFPDANHRTGMATLSRLVLSNDIIDTDHPWPGPPETIGKAVLFSKIQRYLSPRVTFSTLWKRDTLYWHWNQYFDALLNGTRYETLDERSEGTLREKLRQLRQGR